MLYVFDPTAMHHIIVKDQYVFEETRWFIKCVHCPFADSRELTTSRSNRLFLGPGLLGTLGLLPPIPISGSGSDNVGCR